MDQQFLRMAEPNLAATDLAAEDTYFLDIHDALGVALQQNSIERDGLRRLQVCYFDGPTFPDAPVNLISVPLPHFADVFSGSMLPLPSRIQCARDQDEAGFDDIHAAFDDMLADLQAFRQENPDGDFRFGHDAYFFSYKDAYREAIQQKRVKLNHPTVFGLQICYYDGEEFAGAPTNMLHLPAEQLAERLLDAPTRLPASIRIPLGTPDEVSSRLLDVFKQLMSQTTQDKTRLFSERLQRARELSPPGGGKCLKILLATSRYSQVLQFETSDLARAFESLGHDVHVAIEGNAMEQMFEFELVKTYLDFNPDIFIVINNLRNQWIHPDVCHVVWFQDVMQPLVEAKPMAVRDNDQVYSASVELDGYLHNCGVQKPLTQRFCVDTSVFFPPRDDQPRKRIVFVGSAYAPKLSAGPKLREMTQMLMPDIERGKVFSRQEIEAMADRAGVNREQAFWILYHYLTRDHVVRWMCQQLPSKGIEVAVYGRYWRDDAVVAPYFLGEITHGEALADQYRASRFALVCHPFEMNSQRLVEVAACGCTPVVYDCRRVADRPHWDEQCLFFKTPKELSELFDGELPVRDPAPIVAGKTYLDFAQRILRQHRARQTI